MSVVKALAITITLLFFALLVAIYMEVNAISVWRVMFTMNVVAILKSRKINVLSWVNWCACLVLMVIYCMNRFVTSGAFFLNA